MIVVFGYLLLLMMMVVVMLVVLLLVLMIIRMLLVLLLLMIMMLLVVLACRYYVIEMTLCTEAAICQCWYWCLTFLPKWLVLDRRTAVSFLLYNGCQSNYYCLNLALTCVYFGNMGRIMSLGQRKHSTPLEHHS